MNALRRALYRPHAWLVIFLATVSTLHIVWLAQAYGSRHIYLWDESIYCANAVEMTASWNPLRYEVAGVVDHHNSKPPLAILAQAIALKVSGYRPWAPRLTALLALLGMAIVLYRSGRRLTGGYLAGAIAFFLCITTLGLMRPHVFFTADLDAPLTFFATLLYLIRLRQLNEGARILPRDVGWMALAVLLGFLTKSTAMLLHLPGIALSVLLAGQLPALLRMRAFYGFAAGVVGTIALFYLLREWATPGYWQVVWHTEFQRIHTSLQPWLSTPRGVIFDRLWHLYFRPQVCLLVAVAVPYVVVHWRSPRRMLPVGHALLMAACFLGMLTISPERMEWYDAPVYPLLCFAMGLMLSDVLGAAFGAKQMAWWRWMCALLVAAGLTGFGRYCHRANEPYRRYIHEYIVDGEVPVVLLMRLRQHSPTCRQATIVADYEQPHWYDAVSYYQKLLLYQDGTQISRCRYLSGAPSSGYLIVPQQTKADSAIASCWCAVEGLAVQGGQVLYKP